MAQIDDADDGYKTNYYKKRWSYGFFFVCGILLGSGINSVEIFEFLRGGFTNDESSGIVVQKSTTTTTATKTTKTARNSSMMSCHCFVLGVLPWVHPLHCGCGCRPWLPSELENVGCGAACRPTKKAAAQQRAECVRGCIIARQVA